MDWTRSLVSAVAVSFTIGNCFGITCPVPATDSFAGSLTFAPGIALTIRAGTGERIALTVKAPFAPSLSFGIATAFRIAFRLALRTG